MGNYKGWTTLLLLTFLAWQQAWAQDTLRLSRNESEAIFLKENILLIIEELKISQAEAMTLQAKLWPNPNLEIDEINLGTSRNGINGTEYFGDALPPMFGNFGTNQQVTVSIEQLVLTAGKRRKLIAVEEVNESIAAAYFQELLRGLKLEFRNSLSEVQYLQYSKNLYLTQLESIKKLAAAFQNQVALGNVAKGDYIRLKALELELSHNLNEMENKLHEEQKELKLLMNLPSESYLVITGDGYQMDLARLSELNITDLLIQAKENRPDYRISELALDHSNKTLIYEKSQRTPDITFKAGYDRGGSFVYNFLGFGLSMDLPTFNRNQGGIQHAKIAVKSAELEVDYKARELENEVVLAWYTLQNSISLNKSIDSDYESVLDELLQSYTSNFKDRDIGMLAYLDFMGAYLENKSIILENLLDIQKGTEELHFTIGSDLIN